jgi:hypothetical protein
MVYDSVPFEEGGYQMLHYRAQSQVLILHRLEAGV